MEKMLKRREFLAGAAVCLTAGASLVAAGCTDNRPPADPGLGGTDELTPLPPSSPDPNDNFGEDLNINIDTIDQYLNRPDVVYRDLRMFIDPADFAAIGGDPELPEVLEGFRIVPYPFLATLAELPVEGRYTGETLIDISFDEAGSIASVSFNYEESPMVLDDLFPKDMPIFLACGGAGYSFELKNLLVHLGWDASKLYVIGPMWAYRGSRTEELIIRGTAEGEKDIYALWRADYAVIDFSLLHKVS